MIPDEPVGKFKTFVTLVWRKVREWAKAEIAFLLPLLAEWGFDAVTRLAESGHLWAVLIAEVAAVWLVPNKPS